MLNVRKKELWVKDKERCCCVLCGQLFGIFRNRRHHCRSCGEIFCKDCLHPTCKRKLCLVCIKQQDQTKPPTKQVISSPQTANDIQATPSQPQQQMEKHRRKIIIVLLLLLVSMVIFFIMFCMGNEIVSPSIFYHLEIWIVFFGFCKTLVDLYFLCCTGSLRDEEVKPVEVLPDFQLDPYENLCRGGFAVDNGNDSLLRKNNAVDYELDKLKNKAENALNRVWDLRQMDSKQHWKNEKCHTSDMSVYSTMWGSDDYPRSRLFRCETIFPMSTQRVFQMLHSNSNDRTARPPVQVDVIEEIEDNTDIVHILYPRNRLHLFNREFFNVRKWRRGENGCFLSAESGIFNYSRPTSLSNRSRGHVAISGYIITPYKNDDEIVVGSKFVWIFCLNEKNWMPQIVVSHSIVGVMERFVKCIRRMSEHITDKSPLVILND